MDSTGFKTETGSGRRALLARLLLVAWFAALASAGFAAPYEGAPPEPPDEPAAPPLAVAPTGPREMLKLYGIDESNFLTMRDGEPISDAEREVLLRVLYRVRNFSQTDISDWLKRDVTYQDLTERPDDFRGELIPVVGRLEEIVLARPPREVMDRYALEQFFFCKLRLAVSDQTSWVVTSTLPQRWQTEGAVDERVTAAGMFMKISVSPDGRRPLVFVAPRLRWHPDEPDEAAGVNLGMTILGDLGVDVGLLDELKDRRRIIDREREIFYQILWGVDKAGTQELDRYARTNLSRLSQVWQGEVDAFHSAEQTLKDEMAAEKLPLPERKQRLIDLPGRQRKLIAGRCLEEAQRQRFSVFPLFNQPEEHRGQLVALEGTARRAMRIELGKGLQRGGANRDIVARFGIDHYYEVEIFTIDSENNPLVFCVRRLPPGFPEGEAISEPVRIAGFFLKSWSYHTQQPADIRPDGTFQRQQQLAPLLIGREPIWLQTDSARDPYHGIMAGGLFVLAVLGAWLSVWRYSRRDKQFHARVLGPRYAVEEGESLNELGIEAEDGPDFRHLE